MSFTGKRLISAAPTGGLEGEVILQSGTHPNMGQWVVPEGVYSISVLTIDAGTNGGNGWPGSASYPGDGGVGGIRGPVFYRNDVPVVPGQVLDYRIGAASTTAAARQSLLGSTTTRPAGYQSLTVPGVTGGEPGGPGSTTTYESGYGGRATTGISVTNPAGVALSLDGSRNPGTTTSSGNGAAGRTSLWDYGAAGGGGGGGGGGARLDGSQGGVGGNGRRGCIRIVWPGESRQFPYDAA